MAKIGSTVTQGISQKISKVPKSMKEIGTYFFISFERVKHRKMTTNTSRNAQIFWNLFMRQLKGTGVQVARIGMKIAKNTQETEKKTKGPSTQPNTHADLWIRISRTHQGRWIDPDLMGSRSKGPEYGALDRVKTHPVQRLI